MDIDSLPVFSKAELALRNGKVMSEIWVAYRGAIYDVSTSELFEDGKHYQHQAGIDLTEEMGDAPHLDDVMCHFPVVGKLEGTSYEPPTHKDATRSTSTSSYTTSSLYSTPVTNTPPPVTLTPVSSDVGVSEGVAKIRVAEIKNLTPDVRRIRFEYDKQAFSYQAGQYLKIDFGEEIGKRSYSMASHPSNDFLDLVVQKKLGGKATDYLFNELFTGEELAVAGPYSDFVLPQDTNQSLCFICTDVGIAPIRSLLIDIVQQKKSYHQIDLIYGNRFAKDVLFEEELNLFSELIPELTCHFTFSRETYISKGAYKGYVHQVYDKMYATRKNATFFVCGWERMVKEAKQKLTSMGYDKQAIKTQLYI